MASRKVQTALAMRQIIGQFADVVQEIRELDDIFTDSGYVASGDDPIVDEDVVSHDMTAEDLANFSAFRAQLDKFLSGQAAAQVNYWEAINAFRSPGGTPS